MLEDYWLPRREGNRGTEITTLPAGENLGKMEDVEYFQQKLYQSLNVPVTRLQSEQVYSIGRATEITRDEVKFAKFIGRLRAKFSNLFIKCLEKQLVLKGIVTVDDWKIMSQYIRFDYAKDNYYEELKEIEVMTSRSNVAGLMAPYIGKYFSHDYVRRNVFKQSEEDILGQNKMLRAELSDELLYPPPPPEPQQ
jgi:hypothetical protein